MSKVVLSLLGTTEHSEPFQVERAEPAEWVEHQQQQQEGEEPLQRHGTQALGYHNNALHV